MQYQIFKTAAAASGYDTLAGDAGDRFSGGERQRITIARAMLEKSNVVILDEATAYADPESEALIQEAVGRLVSGKTLFVVIHRLSTIQNADQILVRLNMSKRGEKVQTGQIIFSAFIMMSNRNAPTAFLFLNYS